MYRYTSIWDVINILKANLFSSLLILIILSINDNNSLFISSLIILDFILCSVLISVSRVGIRLYFNPINGIKSKKTFFPKKKNVIIIGAGYSGQNIAKQILFDIKNNLNVIGFLDDDISNFLHTTTVSMSLIPLKSF